MKKKKLVVGGIVILFLTAGVAGFFYWRSLAIQLPWQPTPQGVYFEELLPPDISFAMGFHPTDSAERQRFEKLWGAVLQDKKDVVLPFMARESLQRTNDPPIPLEDLLTLFGGDFEFTIANDYFLFRVHDSAKARAAFERLKEPQREVFIDRPDAYVFPFVRRGAGHMGFIGDIGFIAKANEEDTKKFIARFEKRNALLRPASLASTRDFQKAAKSFKDPMSGYIFFAKKDPATFSTVRYTGHDDGLILDSLTVSDIFQSFTPSIASKIPLSKPLLYEEMGHAGSFLLSQFGSLGTDFQKWTGFNFETDILPFLDKDLVLVVEDADKVLPAVSVWMDASAPGAKEKAKTVFEKLDAQVESWVTLGNIALASHDKDKPSEPVFSISKLPPFQTGTKVTIFTDRIDQKIARVPLLQLITEPIEISYGMTADNILFFSTFPNFEKAFEEKQTAEKHPALQLVQSWDIKPGAFVFIDGSAIGAYVERIVALLKADKKFSESEEQTYALLKKHLGPIESFIQVGQGDGASLKSHALLKIRSLPPVPSP